jgi:heme/copper-type cytochrome/quinol oxidase subunit 3
MTVVAALAWMGAVRREHAGRGDVLSLYWHFVDGAWVVVFLVVYVIAR